MMWGPPLEYPVADADSATVPLWESFLVVVDSGSGSGGGGGDGRRVLGAGCWVLGVGHWVAVVLGAGCSVLGADLDRFPSELSSTLAFWSSNMVSFRIEHHARTLDTWEAPSAMTSTKIEFESAPRSHSGGLRCAKCDDVDESARRKCTTLAFWRLATCNMR